MLKDRVLINMNLSENKEIYENLPKKYNLSSLTRFSELTFYFL